MKGQKTLTVQTPEGIVFSLRMASPVSRFLALAIDLLVIYTLAVAVQAAFRLIRIIPPDWAGAGMFLSLLTITLGYGISLEWFWRGQTVGKRFLGLQVTDVHGLRLQFSQIVIRNLLRAVDSLPLFYLVGGVACVLSLKGQRLGDLAANTVVIRHMGILEPDLQQIMPEKYNSFRDHPHIAARLRQNISPGKAAVFLKALMRRDVLAPEARLELFRELRKEAEAAATFPEETTLGLSDERYVRNVADILFRT